MRCTKAGNQHERLSTCLARHEGTERGRRPGGSSSIHCTLQAADRGAQRVNNSMVVIHELFDAEDQRE